MDVDLEFWVCILFMYLFIFLFFFFLLLCFGRGELGWVMDRDVERRHGLRAVASRG